MKILVDTNIVMDALTEREPFAEPAKRLIRAVSEGRAEGFLAAHTVTNLFYLLRHDYTVSERRQILRSLLQIFRIEAIDACRLSAALGNDFFTDFEDCLRFVCTKQVPADVIITRNLSDFAGSSVPCMDAGEFLARNPELSG